jgi:glucosamine--fructose-6-phosphate aminotransferase (isomerizing)
VRKIKHVEAELLEIPYRAKLCLDKNKGLILPEKIPYIGMGASYFAAEVLKYLGVDISVEIASEYYLCHNDESYFDDALIISQSGESLETLTCAKRFKSFYGIVNSADSQLAKMKNARKIVQLYAGTEKHSSTKTFINTLVVLYLGHGIDPGPALQSIHNRFNYFRELGGSMGDIVLKRLKKKRHAGLYIIGSGPNIGTVHQAAQVLTETTKLPFTGFPAAQYNYGLKEAASNSFVIVLNPSGKYYERTNALIRTIENAGALFFEVNEDELSEELSPFSMILPFFFMAVYIADKLKTSDDFIVGDKITLE